MAKLCIIGAGPAGMMAAISAKQHHPELEVLLLDSNQNLGKKLRLSGGGRCNVTAAVSSEELIAAVYNKNGRFLYSSLNEFNTDSIQEFFRNAGCQLKTEDHKRVFPVSDKAEDIIKVLQKELTAKGVEIHSNCRINDLDSNKRILFSQNTEFSYDYLILATGGKSYRETGSDGSGYLLAEKFGHTITELMPTEVPLVSSDKVIADKTLQGLSFKDIELTVYKEKKVVKRIVNDLLFTHFGISGPASLQASYYVGEILKENAVVELTIDFLPELTAAQLEDIPSGDYRDFLHKEQNLPKRLLDHLLTEAKSNEELWQSLKKFPISIYSTKGFSSAFVTSGGINLKEVNPRNMHSKLVDKLAFCGEILDLAASTGGYNISIAFSTGYVAGKYITD